MTNLSIDGSIKEQLLDVSPYTYRAFFLLGLVGICVSGYLLVTGLSHFSANDSARNTFIVGGIFFQILETVCFVTVTSIPGIHRPWKYALIALGVSFFIFSISIMTIAQKATVYGGENETKAIDNELAQLNSQLKTIDSIIESFQANAGKQSKSIYAESRELGREALLDATHLIEKKEKLIGQISELQRDRKETAAGFFVQVENIVGFDARSIEFGFYFIRSLFFEISGIFCFAFGGYLRARKIEHDTQDEVANEEVPIVFEYPPTPPEPVGGGVKTETTPVSPAENITKPTVNKDVVETKAAVVKKKDKKPQVSQELTSFDNIVKFVANPSDPTDEELAETAYRLFKGKKIRSLSRDKIVTGLKDIGYAIGSTRGQRIAQIAKTLKDSKSKMT